MKICKHCEKDLADTEFSPGQGKCKTCRRQQAKENYSAGVKQKQEENYLLRKKQWTITREAELRAEGRTEKKAEVIFFFRKSRVHFFGTFATILFLEYSTSFLFRDGIEISTNQKILFFLETNFSQQIIIFLQNIFSVKFKLSPNPLVILFDNS